jgi:uncharacterized small protein (DUF1192 family)
VADRQKVGAEIRMEKPGMTDCTNDAGCVQADADYLETIALLQDEIARLERELLENGESGPGLERTDRSREDAGDPDALPDRQELQRLGTELAARDETINLLLDQLRLVEEAESASRVEWEQLTKWVAEVEQRVERQDGAGTEKLGLELDAQRRQAEESRSQLDLEHKAWNKQRRGLESEIQRLQALLARAAQEVAAPSDAAAIGILESENQRLRQLCQNLEETIKSEAQSLREAMEVRRCELEEARRERDLLRDERDRERREYEVAVASLRSQNSRAALAAHESEVHATGSDTRSDMSSALEADIRIREFRQHLKEIHCHEAEARNHNRLGARLSRLWSRTGPR